MEKIRMKVTFTNGRMDREYVLETFGEAGTKETTRVSALRCPILSLEEGLHPEAFDTTSTGRTMSWKQNDD